MMRYLNAIFNTIGDLALWAFRWSNPWPAMIVVSLLATILLLLIVRAFSNPTAISKSKRKLIARVMEIHLFRNDPVVAFSACWRIFKANLIYFQHLIRPICCTAVPGILILIQLNCWFSHRPLHPGETAILKVQLTSATPILDHKIKVVASDSLTVDPQSLRIPSLNQVNLNLRADQLGTGWVEIISDGVPIRKEVIVADRLAKLSERKVQAGFWDMLLHPVETPIDVSSPVQSIEIQYPQRKMYVGLMEIDWIIAFLLLTIIFGVILKGPLKATL